MKWSTRTDMYWLLNGHFLFILFYLSQFRFFSKLSIIFVERTCAHIFQKFGQLSVFFLINRHFLLISLIWSIWKFNENYPFLSDFCPLMCQFVNFKLSVNCPFFILCQTFFDFNLEEEFVNQHPH